MFGIESPKIDRTGLRSIDDRDLGRDKHPPRIPEIRFVHTLSVWERTSAKLRFASPPVRDRIHQPQKIPRTGIPQSDGVIPGAALHAVSVSGNQPADGAGRGVWSPVRDAAIMPDGARMPTRVGGNVGNVGNLDSVRVSQPISAGAVAGLEWKSPPQPRTGLHVRLQTVPAIPARLRAVTARHWSYES